MDSVEKLGIVYHTLQVIGLESEQINYVTEYCRRNTPLKMKQWKPKDIRSAAGHDGNKYNEIEATDLIRLTTWYRNYLGNGGNNIVKEFTEEVWESFDIDDNEEKENKSVEQKTTMKISLSDYKSFDGTYKEWSIMKRQFTATANAHGYGDYINTDYEIPDEDETGYKNI